MGALAFFIFFLVCGVLGNLAYAAIHPGSASRSSARRGPAPA